MTSVTLGIKVDDSLRDRIKAAAQTQGRTPHWLIKQAVVLYLESLERGKPLPPLNTDPAGSAQPLMGQAASLAATPGDAELPFLDWAQGVLPQTERRADITAAWHRPEPDCVAMLLPLAQVNDAEQRQRIEQLALRLVQGLRTHASSGGVEALVQEFSLSSQEGVALMCMAEALLRIPDNATRDALIRDKLSRGDWQAHLGNSPSLFVNAAVWGLMLTGKLTATASEKSLASALTRLIGRRRAADPPGRAPRHEADGRAIRHRPDHRRSAGQQPRDGKKRLSLFVRHAGRSRHHRGRRRALCGRLRASHPRHRQSIFRAGNL